MSQNIIMITWVIVELDLYAWIENK